MTILAATDFSPEALAACRLASALAKAWCAPLTLVHVLEPATLFPLSLDDPTPNPEMERLTMAKRLLDTVRDKLGADGKDAKTEVLHGFVEDALGAYVRSHKPQLLVVGGDGRDGAQANRAIAEQLAESMPCPVLVTRPITDLCHHALAGKHRLRITIAVERSHASDGPIAWGMALRAVMPCDITLRYFYDPLVEHKRLGIPLGAELFVPDRRVVVSLERELRQRIAGLHGQGELVVKCEPHVGMVSVEALCSARVDDADLIVVGTHQRRGMARFLHGSVSREIIRHSDVPVVCVKPEAAALREHRKIHKVLAATDLTDAGNRAIPYAFDMLANGGGEIDIVYVASKAIDGIRAAAPGDAGRLSPAQREQLVGRLERLIPEGIDRAEVTTRCYVIDGGPPADAIVNAAARWNADAICMASRGLTALERAFAASVATEVIQAAECPVLVVRDVDA